MIEKESLYHMNFSIFCEKHCIKRQFSIAKNPQQNGVAERMNKIVEKMAHSMVYERWGIWKVWNIQGFGRKWIGSKDKMS